MLSARHKGRPVLMTDSPHQGENFSELIRSRRFYDFEYDAFNRREHPPGGFDASERRIPIEGGPRSDCVDREIRDYAACALCKGIQRRLEDADVGFYADYKEVYRHAGCDSVPHLRDTQAAEGHFLVQGRAGQEIRDLRDGRP